MNLWYFHLIERSDMPIPKVSEIETEEQALTRWKWVAEVMGKWGVILEHAEVEKNLASHQQSLRRESFASLAKEEVESEVRRLELILRVYEDNREEIFREAPLEAT